MLSIMLHINSIRFACVEVNEMKKPESSAIAATEMKMGKHWPSRALVCFRA